MKTLKSTKMFRIRHIDLSAEKLAGEVTPCSSQLIRKLSCFCVKKALSERRVTLKFGLPTRINLYCIPGSGQWTSLVNDRYLSYIYDFDSFSKGLANAYGTPVIRSERNCLKALTLRK